MQWRHEEIYKWWRHLVNKKKNSIPITVKKTNIAATIRDRIRTNCCRTGKKTKVNMKWI